MTEHPSSDGADAPAVLTAFLRGVERRGLVFADLLAGDRTRAEQGFAVALRQFREQADGQPFAAWPRLFWRTLCASPGLAAPASTHAAWAGELAPLARLAPPARAALLLRLVAGLTEGDAADVLGIAPGRYRLALRRALPHAADGSADPVRWGALAGAIQQAVHAIPAERLAHLARLRQAAVQGRRPDLIGPMPVPAAEVEAPAPRPLVRRILWGGVAACVLGLLATFVWPTAGGGGDDASVHVSPLGRPASPEARYDAEAALLTERDFELLAAGQAQPPLDDPAFYAWYDAGAPAPAGDAEEKPGARSGEAPASESAVPESADAP